jgi:hypothetical protein
MGWFEDEVVVRTLSLRQLELHDSGAFQLAGQNYECEADLPEEHTSFPLGHTVPPGSHLPPFGPFQDPTQAPQLCCAGRGDAPGRISERGRCSPPALLQGADQLRSHTLFRLWV